MDTHEQTLVKELVCGSTHAFEKLYKMYSSKIMSFALSYTKSRELSEEIVQDVFVSLWNSRSNIKKHDKISSLIFTIAKNKLISNYRKSVNSPIYEEYVNYCDTIAVSINNTTHHIEFDEFMIKLNSIVANLTKTQQDVFRLSKLENLSNQEISEKLDLSYQTVRNQLSLAIKQIRDGLLIIILILMSLYL